MATDELLRLIFVGGLIALPVVCVVLIVVRLARSLPRWPGYVCLSAFLVGAGASFPVAQSAAAKTVEDPARW